MSKKNPVRIGAKANYDDEEEWLAGLDPAWAKARLFFRGGERYAHKDGAPDVTEAVRGRSLPEVHRELSARHKRYLAGDTMELLHAIKTCAEENLPLAEWIALEFIGLFSSLGKVGGPTSLDAIFYSREMPTSTPKKAARAQQEWQLGAQLRRAVWGIAERHNGLSPALDEVLKAKNWGVKKTTATRLVKMVDKTHSELSGQQSLSQFWAKQRKS